MVGAGERYATALYPKFHPKLPLFAEADHGLSKRTRQSPAGQVGGAREGCAQAEAATCWTSRTRRRAGEGQRWAGGLGALWWVPHAPTMLRLSLLRIPGPSVFTFSLLLHTVKPRATGWRASWGDRP